MVCWEDEVVVVKRWEALVAKEISGGGMGWLFTWIHAA
jgi:hypothetical protein